MDRPIMDVQDVADLFGLSKKTVYAHCKDGTLPHFQFGAGSKLFFRQDQILRLFEQRGLVTTAEGNEAIA
jgi:predicted DNA-binding transcriptional regulator AlpA